LARAETYTTPRDRLRYDSRVLAATTVHVIADAAGLRTAAEAVDAFCRVAGVPRAVVWRLQLALDEVISNLERHTLASHPHVEVISDADNSAVSLTIIDDGPAFDPLAAPGQSPPVSGPLEARPIGGLGLMLLNRVVDRASYRRDGGRNVLVVTCRLSGSSLTAS
jgi:serine/threonine-protein kinase RsbW